MPRRQSVAKCSMKTVAAPRMARSSASGGEVTVAVLGPPGNLSSPNKRHSPGDKAWGVMPLLGRPSVTDTPPDI